MENKSKKDLKHWEEQLHHIFYYKTFTFCMVCVENVEVDLSRDKKDLVTSHFLTSKHRENARSLFKMCIADPLCDSPKKLYRDIVENSVFDISLLLSGEPSYISQRYEHFVCLVCQSQLCKTSDDHQILIGNLISHLRSELHLKSVKDNVCWVYRQNASLDFIMFYKSVIYCSTCKLTMKSAEDRLLCTVVDHLQTSEHKIHQSPNSKIDISAINVNVCKQFETLTIADDDLQSDPTVLNDSVSSDTEDSSKESYNFCVDSSLVCSDCGAIIEIYNENAEFSIQLHSQKHRDLSSINDNLGIDFKEDIDYVCPICQETIQIYNKNVELSVNRHFENCHQNHKGFGLSDNNDDEAGNHLVNTIFSDLPESLEVHHDYVSMDGNEMFCKLCNCTLLSSKDASAASDMLKNHLLSNYHVQQHKSLGQQVTSAIINYNKQNCNLGSSQEPNNAFETLLERHPILKKNKQFIERYGVNYFCNMCKKQISYSPKIDTLSLNFESHFKSSRHKDTMELVVNKKKGVMKTTIIPQTKNHSKIKKIYMKCDDQTGINEHKREVEEVIKRFSKQYPELFLNKDYIKEKDGHFFCEVCQKSFPFSHNGFILRSHTSSISHNKKLTFNMSVYMSELKYEIYVPNLVQTDGSFSEVLQGMQKNQYLKPHIQCILFDYKNFICLLCNRSISFSQCGTNVMNHIFNPIHLQNAYRINQIYNSNELLLLQNTTEKSEKNSQIQGQQNCFFNTVEERPSVVTPIGDNSLSAKELTKSNSKARKQLFNLAAHAYWFVQKHRKYIEIRNGNFFCTFCKESVKSTSSGKYLKEHFLKKVHNKK